MGEFDKNQGQADQTGQFGDKSAFGQFDNDQNQEDRVERTEQGQDEFAGADSSKRESEIGGQGDGQQGDFGGKQEFGQDQTKGQDREQQQGDNQFQNEQNQYQGDKGQGDDQNR